GAGSAHLRGDGAAAPDDRVSPEGDRGAPPRPPAGSEEPDRAEAPRGIARERRPRRRNSRDPGEAVVNPRRVPLAPRPLAPRPLRTPTHPPPPPSPPPPPRPPPSRPSPFAPSPLALPTPARLRRGAASPPAGGQESGLAARAREPSARRAREHSRWRRRRLT